MSPQQGDSHKQSSGDTKVSQQQQGEVSNDNNTQPTAAEMEWEQLEGFLSFDDLYRQGT
jgi:hypothetical protein